VGADKKNMEKGLSEFLSAFRLPYALWLAVAF
jgi:hypothetical protein